MYETRALHTSCYFNSFAKHDRKYYVEYIFIHKAWKVEPLLTEVGGAKRSFASGRVVPSYATVDYAHDTGHAVRRADVIRRRPLKPADLRPVDWQVARRLTLGGRSDNQLTAGRVVCRRIVHDSQKHLPRHCVSKNSPRIVVVTVSKRVL